MSSRLLRLVCPVRYQSERLRVHASHRQRALHSGRLSLHPVTLRALRRVLPGPGAHRHLRGSRLLEQRRVLVATPLDRVDECLSYPKVIRGASFGDASHIDKQRYDHVAELLPLASSSDSDSWVCDRSGALKSPV